MNAAIDPLPTPDDVIAAATRLADIAIKTPVLTNRALDQRLGGTGWLKPEILQHTGSFKFRGAYNRLVQLTAQQRKAGVVAFSSGNHAQGVALAGQMLDMPVTIVMPDDAPRLKVKNTQSYGAAIVYYNRERDDRETITRRLADEKGAVVVPAFDDRHVIAGQGTIGLELADEASARQVKIDQVLVCCSGGGIAAGIALGFEARGQHPDIYTVEPQEFDDYQRSLAAGMILKNAKASGSICDALMSRRPGNITFAVAKSRLKGGLVVSDHDVRQAVGFAFDKLKLVVEPGGAVALAAALGAKLPTIGRTTAIILSGGNVDIPMYAECLAAE